MIKSFACKYTAALFHNRPHRKLSSEWQQPALRKLRLIESAVSVNDLRLPPGNRLEKLSGDRAGQYSIRINAQFRICFRFSAGDAQDVEIVDYH